MVPSLLVHPLRLDVRFQDSVDLCMDTLKASLKKTGTQLVALVNNAGVGSVAPCEFVDLDEARDVFEVNYFGLIRMSKACIPLLRETGPGTRIVNIGSVSGLVASPGEFMNRMGAAAIQSMFSHGFLAESQNR